MKQPELGRLISELRKEKNLTQEDLVESCNVSVRTIQRIESGEVTPRSSTIRILLAALGEDLDSFKSQVTTNRSDDDLRSYEHWFQTAWVAGIIYFIAGFLDASFEYMRYEQGELSISHLIYIPTKILYFCSYSIFMMGLIKLGEFFNNHLLKITGYLMIGLFAITTFIDILSLFVEFSDVNLLSIGAAESMSVGAVGIILGVGLIRLQDSMGMSAKAAGLIEIIAGFFFCTVILFFVGYIMLIPSIILEIVILFRASEFVKEEIHR